MLTHEDEFAVRLFKEHGKPKPRAYKTARRFVSKYGSWSITCPEPKK